MISYKSVSTKIELDQILELQRVNLPVHISSKEKKDEGFVTVQHDMKILSKMNDEHSHIIAKHNEKVVAYALCMHPKFADEIELLKPMFEQIKSEIDPSLSYMAMGQICIDKEYRKQGVFRKLYEKMQASLAHEFTSIITEVDINNYRSLEAHYAIGFKCLKAYSSGGQDWELLVLDWQE